MWHWNSWWAPAPGDPPAVDDPKRWQAPWSVEQALACQTRCWETWLSASHAWWALALTSWPTALPPTANTASAEPAATPRLPPARKRPATRRRTTA